MPDKLLSSLPDVFEMMWRITGDDVDDVDTHIFGIVQKARNEEIGRGSYPLQAPEIE